MIHTSFTYRKLNMDEICVNLWLKVLFIMCTYITEIFIEIPPCAKKVIFITEFAICGPDGYSESF